MTQFIVFKKNDGYNNDMWNRHVIEVDTTWSFIDANELGRQLGAGRFIYWEADAKYPQVKQITIGSITQYEEIDEDETADEESVLSAVPDA